MITSQGLLDLYLIPWPRYLLRKPWASYAFYNHSFSNCRWAEWEVEGMFFHLGKALPLIH